MAELETAEGAARLGIRAWCRRDEVPLLKLAISSPGSGLTVTSDDDLPRGMFGVRQYSGDSA